MTATIIIVALALGTFVASFHVRKASSSRLLSFAMIGCTAYLVIEAVRSWMNQYRIFAHNLVALTSVTALVMMLYRIATHSGHKSEIA